MKVLFVGESWVVHMVHVKGFDSFQSSKYEEGATYLLQCLKEGGVDVDYMPAHEVQVRFPQKLGELQLYDVIVLSDIGSNSFLLQNSTFYGMEKTSNALALIKEYVAQGGGLLMIGGYLSFTGIESKANYKNTILADVLPVEMKSHDDRIEKPEGINPTTVQSHFITGGIDKWPSFLGYNQFEVKSDAEVLVKVNDDPFLVVGEFGKGRTGCFASDCAPHWGSKEFMEWDMYQHIWVRILQYLEGGNEYHKV